MQFFNTPTTKQGANEKAIKIYLSFLCGLMAVVIATSWLREACHNTKKARSKASSKRLLAARHRLLLAFQKLERRVNLGWFGRPSLGYALIIGSFIAANAILCSNILALRHLLNHWASRFGWMSAINMMLCVFFGLKNTPLSRVAHISHAELNYFHRLAGYVAVLLLALHAIVYTVHFGRQGRLVQLLKKEDLEGIGAGVAMLVLLMGIARHRRYELFYISHIVAFGAAVILTGLHRPNWAKKIPVVMSFTAAMWLVDRMIRGARMVLNLINNSATFYSLPDSGTRVILRKPGVKKMLPGTHCFLWIPRIHPYENHPFTVVSNDSAGLELVMKAHQGFTRRVDEFSRSHSNRTAWASVDGPYGSLPDTESYDKLVLVAGGSGAAFTFGLMNQHLSWFQEHLHRISRSGSSIDVKLYVTGDSSREGTSTEMPSNARTNEGAVNYGSISHDTEGLLTSTTSNEIEDAFNIRFEKVNIEQEIGVALEGVATEQRVLVATCGPESLMDDVRDSADRWRNSRGLRIDIHFENF
ncbi:Ferric/cupric reductase transmembrane component 1 [Colletotrichum siamense]|uniref:ferric-chelate reductase (NADPH) n=1 Tax=Colletotrichum siamense TaxID=690259 RepID=A0A9P5F370_COLSI|nr:Ferric/cupric reductase transmembrane component 1 [Colletotrichum siamense]KAF4865200.1 Ferric/cupric reductase transmembrane component 1 [Colletotrichum siamense]